MLTRGRQRCEQGGHAYAATRAGPTHPLPPPQVVARHDSPAEEASYTFTMVQRQGGPYDGYWMTESVVADSVDWAGSIVSW